MSEDEETKLSEEQMIEKIRLEENCKTFLWSSVSRSKQMGDPPAVINAGIAMLKQVMPELTVKDSEQ